MSSLNDKQEMFCREYLVDLNATQAAIRAGYSKRNANRIASENLSKLDIQKRIATLKAERIEDVRTDANFVLKRLLDIISLDIQDILDDQGNLLPVSVWPKEWRTSVDAFDILSVKSSKKQISMIRSIRMPNKLKSIELLGKHIDISAFKDKLELTGKDGGELVINVISKKAKEGIDKLKESLS